MSFLCVLDQGEDKEPAFQIENDASRLVRLMRKGWKAYRLEQEHGLPLVGLVVTLSEGVEVSRSIQHEVAVNGEVIGTGSVNVATNPE